MTTTNVPSVAPYKQTAYKITTILGHTGYYVISEHFEYTAMGRTHYWNIYHCLVFKERRNELQKMLQGQPSCHTAADVENIIIITTMPPSSSAAAVRRFPACFPDKVPEELMIGHESRIRSFTTICTTTKSPLGGHQTSLHLNRKNATRMCARCCYGTT